MAWDRDHLHNFFNLCFSVLFSMVCPWVGGECLFVLSCRSNISLTVFLFRALSRRHSLSLPFNTWWAFTVDAQGHTSARLLFTYCWNPVETRMLCLSTILGAFPEGGTVIWVHLACSVMPADNYPCHHYGNHDAHWVESLVLHQPTLRTHFHPGPSQAGKPSPPLMSAGVWLTAWCHTLPLQRTHTRGNINRPTQQHSCYRVFWESHRPWICRQVVIFSFALANSSILIHIRYLSWLKSVYACFSSALAHYGNISTFLFCWKSYNGSFTSSR